MEKASTYSVWPVAVYGVLCLGLVLMMIALSHLLGEKHESRGRDEPYESGIQPTGSALLRYDAWYYMVGLFFILFDVEAAILLTWAVAFRESGWTGYFAALLFVVTLFVGLVYVWKLGALDWYPGRRRKGRGGVR